jgi:hypothetical protein
MKVVDDPRSRERARWEAYVSRFEDLPRNNRVTTTSAAGNMGTDR